MRPAPAPLLPLLLALLWTGCPRSPSGTGSPDAAPPMPPTPPAGTQGPAGTPARPTAPSPAPPVGVSPPPSPGPEEGGSAPQGERSPAPTPDGQEAEAEVRRYRVRDNGTRCITWPCPSWDVQDVETGQVTQVHEVDLSPLSDEERQRAEPALSQQGLTVRGTIVTEQRRRGAQLMVEVVRLRVLGLE